MQADGVHYQAVADVAEAEAVGVSWQLPLTWNSGCQGALRVLMTIAETVLVVRAAQTALDYDAGAASSVLASVARRRTDDCEAQRALAA